jgi:pimeloyl-ACP methyl ester carboxylesterase
MADAMVPASERFAGVQNDVKVQQELEELPLGAVRAPTLVIGSRRDGDIGWDNSVHAADNIRDAELIGVEQFGHLIWWGDPEVTRDIEGRVEEFLGQHARV